MIGNISDNTAFLARKQICDLLNISRTTLWRIEREDPTFPKPFNFGIKKEQWIQGEILEWTASTRSASGLAGGITAATRRHIGKIAETRVYQ